jgi:hypothetical protein
VYLLLVKVEVVVGAVLWIQSGEDMTHYLDLQLAGRACVWDREKATFPPSPELAVDGVGAVLLLAAGVFGDTGWGVPLVWVVVWVDTGCPLLLAEMLRPPE